MREIDSKLITNTVKEACIDLNINVNPELKKTIEEALNNEISDIGKNILEDILENFSIAKEKKIPICQDTGMVIVFAEIGQDVHIVGDNFNDAINKGVSEGYINGFLRKSIVEDPLNRFNTKDNTPAIIYTEIVPGENITLTITTKGFGSENNSALKMLKPADGIEGVKKFCIETIENALPNSCAPMIVGIGIGGDFEKSALNSKKALTLPIDYKHPKKIYQNLAEDIKNQSNKMGYGPMGLGGRTSVLNVNIIESPTHIAGLPVAVNICCYIDRSITKKL